MAYTIMIVDDDTDFRQEMKDCLYEYNVIEARNGTQALDILEQPNEVDVVLLDVMLPKERGTEILKTIKEKKTDVKIIIMTGHSSEAIAIDALKGRADDYLEKPVKVDNLKRIINDFLKQKSGIQEIDDLDQKNKIERIQKYLKRNYDKKVSLQDVGKLVHLSPKYVSRLFKTEAGMGFAAFKVMCKLDVAKEMLTTTGIPIEQIAYKLGYQNTESFIRIFKKNYNMTPKEFRLQKC